MKTPGQLFFNGDIVTMDPSNRSAEAVATENGKIAAVGSKSYCQSHLARGHEEIDLAGMALLPGFIDTHLHPTLMVLHELYADCSDLKSIDELKNRFRGMRQDKPTADWIIGLQFDEQAFISPQLPNRHDLDEACPDHPAVLLKRDGHSLIANTRAIREAGINADSANPVGGEIDRENDGYPAGMFRENAMGMIASKIPFPDLQSVTDAASSVFKKITRFGITSAGVILQTGSEGVMGEMGAFDIPLMEMVIEHIPISMYCLLAAEDAKQITDLRTSKLHQDLGEGHRVGGLKFWADGSFGSCTAKMKEPFTDYPDKSGFLVDKPEVFYKRMVEAHNAGLQLAMHSIGDESSRICLELFDRLLTEYPREGHRHRIEHASVLNEKLVREFARLGIVASVQPMFIASEKDWLYKRIGKERAKWTYPFRSFLDHGVIISGSSDAPIETPDVMHAVQCCVTREGFETQQSISVEAALKMFTQNGAYAHFEETVKGSITAGKRADLIILGANPLKVPVDEIKEIQIEKTFCHGFPV